MCVSDDTNFLRHLSRTHHVHQLVLKPTWKTAVMRKKLKGRPSDFRIGLMDGKRTEAGGWFVSFESSSFFYLYFYNIPITKR